MRDLLMLATMSVLVPIALAEGFIAYVLWAWTSVFSPNFYMYGFMAAIRYNLVFASIALLSLLLSGKRPPLEWNTTQKLLLIFLIHATLCAIFGYPFNRLNVEVYEGLVKALLFCLVMPTFINSRLRLHVLLVALTIGMGFHGLLEGAKFIASGGEHKVTGIATAMISDNNHFAVGQLMIIPILFFLYRYTESRVVRIGFLGAFVLTAFAVMGTFSRGGFIGLIALGLWMVFSSRQKFLSLLIVVAVALTLSQVAPDSWFDRVDTINNAGEDTSFMGRITAWKISFVIALNNPVFGGGFHSVQALNVWTAFKDSIGFLAFIPTPESQSFGRAAHSIYFEVLGDAGFVGLLLFLAIWINAWRTALRVKRTTRDQPELVWVRDLCDMLCVALLVYAISGAAVSMAYFELFYIFAAMIAILEQYVVRHTAQARTEVSTPSVEPISVPIGVRTSRSSRSC